MCSICIICSKSFIPSTRYPNRKCCCVQCDRKYQMKKIRDDPDRYERHLEMHRNYRRKKVRQNRGLPLDHPRLMRKNGEGTIHKEGYKIISIGYHANAQKKGLILEHILIMTQYLNRPLIKGENVHHKNGNRSDNRIENLELWTTKQPPGQRVEDKIKFYKEQLEFYGFSVIKKTV